MTSEEVISGAIWDQFSCIEDKIIGVDTEETIQMKIMREAGVDLEKGSIQKILRRNDRSSSSRSRSSSRASTNRDRVRCYKCREY